MLTVDFADVLRQIPAIGVPGAVFADGKRAGGGDVRRRHRAVAGAFRAIVIHRQSAEIKPRSLTKTDLGVVSDLMVFIFGLARFNEVKPLNVRLIILGVIKNVFL